MKCNRRPWHRWSDWRDEPITVSPGLLSQVTGRGLFPPYLAAGQIRSCVRCGAEQLREKATRA